jgi:hypothetical protein
MGKLLYHLPPLSPDYSGAASVFHDLGSLTVIHDASGCTGTYTGYDEPRWFGSKSAAFCSGLREMDAIMGDDEQLLSKIEEAAKEIEPSCVVVIGSPVPMIIGFDFAGFAALVEDRAGLPCFAFPATGLAYYDAGQKAAYLAVAKRFLEKDTRKAVPNRVNILGASVLDGFDDEKLDAMVALLRDNGLDAGAVWGMRTDMEGLRETPKAAVNWVVTAAALPLARYLQERFDIPFIAGVPQGEGEAARIVRGLQAACGGAGDAGLAGLRFPPVRAIPEGVPCNTLLAGEGLFCASLRAKMEAEDESRTVSVGSFFASAAEIFAARDRLFACEDDLEAALSNDALELVAGDPLFRDLMPRSSKARFVEIPHRAVSGRLYQ